MKAKPTAPVTDEELKRSIRFLAGFGLGPTLVKITHELGIDGGRAERFTPDEINRRKAPWQGLAPQHPPHGQGPLISQGVPGFGEVLGAKGM